MKSNILSLIKQMARYCLVVWSLLLILPANSQTANEGVVIFKVLPQYRTSCYDDSVSLFPIKNVYNEVQGSSITKIFPNHQPPDSTYDTLGRKLVDLSLIYKMEFSTSYSVDSVVQKIERTGTVEYAEKDYILETLYQPNDPISQPISPQPWVIPNQNFLQIIKAQQAWDITKGDPSIVIGIVDTYFQINHPDLANKIAVNSGDPIDGVDNDMDGYLDNYYGWHFCTNSYDVTSTCGPSHGTPVAGAAAADTDNNTGVASTGFNSSFLPVAGLSYPGIIYAVDHGAVIVNNSWRGGGTNYERDIVDYAAVNKDAVVIAAAGNTEAEINYYPASFDNVMSVTASNANTAVPADWPIDIKVDWSTWSTKVDIMAPGNGIGTTTDGSSYNHGVGTSFSAPLVAGAAGLVRWRYPFLREFEVRELIRATSDDVYSVSNYYHDNMDYYEKLGKGRLNMEEALSCDTIPTNFYNCAPPALRVINKNVYGLCGTTIPTTPVTLDLDFRNHLGNTSGVTVQVSTSDPDITMNTSSAVLGTINNMQTASNVQFTFTLGSGVTAPLYKVVTFRIYYTYSGGYTDYEYIDVLLETQPSNNTLWGPSNVCYTTKSGIVYGTTLIANATYDWTVPSGATITFGQGTSTIYVNFGSEGGTVEVEITTENGCVWAITKNVQITCPPGVTYTNVHSSDNSLPANTVTTSYVYAYDDVIVNTGTSVSFHANNYILLDPGFQTEASSTFLADLNGCSGCTNSKIAYFQQNNGSEPYYPGTSPLPFDEGEPRVLDPSLAIEVFPMPSTGLITVRSKTIIKEIIVNNIYGTTVSKIKLEEECYEKAMDLENHEPGLYTIQVNDGVNTYADKILIVR